MSTGVKTVTLSHPSHTTTVKHLPKISRHIACGAAGIQQGAEAAARQVATQSEEYSTQSCSVREAVNKQFFPSDAIKAQTVLMSKEEIKKEDF